MKRLFAVIVAVWLCAFGLNVAGAFALPVQSPPPELRAPAASPLIIDVRHGGGHLGGFNGRPGYRPYRPGYNRLYYNNHRYSGRRCSYYSSYCRYRYGGYYYPYRWWLGGVAVGTAVAVGNNASKHKNWCANKYRSYNAKNNTWVAKGGKVKKCVSPYKG